MTRLRFGSVCFLLLCTTCVRAWKGYQTPAAAEKPRFVISGHAPALADSHFDGIEDYTQSEVGRVFQEHLGAVSMGGERRLPRVVIGTVENNPAMKKLVETGFVKPVDQEQGYAIRCGKRPGDDSIWLLAICGTDVQGALYGLRDLEHYYLKYFGVEEGRLIAQPFAAEDFPRIQSRGHWVWGCNMPDKKAWLENMSRWKMNELIHWDNFPPKKAKEYVDFAHSRGIKVIWGFGWGWNPNWNFNVPEGFDRGVGDRVQMCGSSRFNLDFYQREILRKVREDYVPSGCDGIYFQAFTEVPKCKCAKCRDKTMGEVMLAFVNPIANAIKREFPDLWISCGIHANLGKFDFLNRLDPRLNIYWENCDSGISVRDDEEDFGYINKTLPYSHGFSKTCPADPSYTEESLNKWMASNAHRYTLGNELHKHQAYLRSMQNWALKMMGKPKAQKHGSTVADHSVFCRRTPFMHLALAEAMWNPEIDANTRAKDMTDFLGLKLVEGRRSAKVRHDAIGAKLTIANRCSDKYPGGSPNAIIDGLIANRVEVGAAAWQGYLGDDLDTVIDLGKETSIASLSSSYLQAARAGVFIPKTVEYAISNDGKAFQTVEVLTNGVSVTDMTEQRKAFTIHGLDLDARYVRVRAKNLGVMPAKDDSRAAWLFVEEVMVNPVLIGDVAPKR